MLSMRVLTAVIALPLALYILIFAPYWLASLVFILIVGLSSFELSYMLIPKLEEVFGSGSKKKQQKNEWLVTTAVICSCLVFIGAAMMDESSQTGFILFGVLASILIGAFLASSNELAFGRIVALLMSVCYGCLPWLATWNLYTMGPGGRYTILLIAVVWSGDTGAYFGGRYFGKRKLAPRMSPNKTIEGALSGLLASVVAGCLMQIGYSGDLGSWQQILLASLFGGLFGQMGDLVESTIKRFADVKDSGFIFPGHGGFLDRVDGIIFAAPAMCFILYAIR